MQDRRTHIDRKFTNHAWGEMRQLLDREMPVSERRRRKWFFGWWLLPVGLALGVAAWGFLKNDKSQPAPAPPVNAPAQPIADGSDSTATRSEVEPATPPAQNPAISPAENLKTAQTTTVSHSSGGVLKPRNAASGSGNPLILGGANAESQNPAAPKDGMNALYTDPLSQTAGSKTDLMQVIENEATKPGAWTPSLTQNALSELSYPAIFPSLQLPEIAPKTTPENTVALDLAIEKPVAEKTRFSFFTGGMAAGSSPANGLTVGSAATIPLKNSKLALEGGLSYALVQQPLSVQVNEFPQTNTGSADTDSIGDELVYAFDNSNKSANGYASQTNYSTGVYLHYFQLPVSVRYTLTSKISAHGGALAAYLFDLTQGSYDHSIQLEAGSNEAVVDYSNTTVKIPLSRFDLAATGGLTWQFSRAFAVDFQYRMGVADLLKSNERGDFNRLFQLSLSYRLKGK